MVYISEKEQARRDAEYMKDARKRSWRRVYREVNDVPDAPTTLPFRTITESEYHTIKETIKTATRNVPYRKREQVSKNIFFEMLNTFVQMRDIDPCGSQTRAIVVSEPSEFDDGYYSDVVLKKSCGITVDIFTKRPTLQYYEGKYLLDKPVKDFVIVVPDESKPQLTDAERILNELLSELN